MTLLNKISVLTDVIWIVGGALCTSFILSAVHNDCVSSSERASIANN